MTGWGCVPETLKIILGQRGLGFLIPKSSAIIYQRYKIFRILGVKKFLRIIVIVQETMIFYLVSRKLCVLNNFILSDELMLNLCKKHNRTIQWNNLTKGNMLSKHKRPYCFGKQKSA